MKVTALLKNVAKKSTVLRMIMRNCMYGMYKVRYLMRAVSCKTDDRLVVFSAYSGKNYACSPKAVYEYMIREDRFSGYRSVWIFDDPGKYGFLEKNRDTLVVRKGSAECERFLAEAKYWIFNFRAPDHWKTKKDQVYVQCWHGTPLKRLGYDIINSDNAMNSVSEIRTKYRTDAQRFNYIISSCPFVTDKFTSAWNLDASDRYGKVVETGYPRNDFLNVYSDKDADKIKRRLGIADCDRKVILYAPTWRDNQHDSESGYVYRSPVDFNYLRSQLEDEYIILFRAHYLVADDFDFDAYRGFIYDVSGYDDINDLYIAADLLITDYSSVFFDYAILNRPILFYMYDMEEYRDEMRGFYLDIGELPGSVVKTEGELVDIIKATDFGGSKDLHRKFNDRYNSMNDGNAAERLTELIFR